jgi:hypothetical protein
MNDGTGTLAKVILWLAGLALLALWCYGYYSSAGWYGVAVVPANIAILWAIHRALRSKNYSTTEGGC